MIIYVFCDREPLKAIYSADPSPGFAATPKTFITCPQDPAWTLSALSARDNGSSDEEEPFAVTPQDAEVLQVYNTAMSKLAIKSSSSADNFSPLESRLKTSWENTTELDRQKCQEKALQGCLLVCEVIAPNAKDDLFQVLSKQSSRESEDDLSKELSGLMTAYRDAPTKSVKLQILSLYAYRFSTEKLMRYHEPYEPLTRWQIKQARRYAKEKGPGIPQEKTVQHRIRFPMAKVDHFIDFVNRPYFYQDVAYGTRLIKLETGEKLTMPNVVRTVTRTTMINQYLQYCDEERFSPLCTRTLYKILEVREASQRRSLQGLDNIATDGAAGFETREKLVDELKSLGAVSKWCGQSKTTLKACKRYLKTEYPINCRDGQPSTCPDHCRNFALGDNSDDAFKVECHHVHDTVCNNCEFLKTVLREMEDQIRNECIAFYSKDHQEDILYDFVKAKQSILDWKAHILRSCNQEQAKQDRLQNLTTSEAIVVMDWAMKFQQMKFREKQSEWFGKRGLSWHISSVIFKDENSKKVEVQSYAHLFDSCTQDWYAVASILEDLLVKFKSTHPSISQVYLRSDEAGCYHNNSLIAALPSIGEHTGISVRRFDHSEPQHGKDICDRILCPMKAAIRTFCNEGHDILTANDIHIALKERQVKGTTAAVCSVDESNKNAEVRKLEGFSKFHNVSFEFEGIRVWRCYGIGSRKFVPYKSLIVQPQKSPSLITKEPFFPISVSRVLKLEKKTSVDSASVFVCPEPGCIKTFGRFADFELHLDVGEHVVQNKPAVLEHNVYDKLKRDWVAMFATVQTGERQSQHHQPCTHSEESVPEANMGWALAKARSGSSQFSEKVKDYLTKKFNIGEKTEQKVSAEQVAKDMCNARTHDNRRLFGREDWLTKLQVQGFFSRLASARRKQGWHEADTSEEDDEGDEVGEQRHAVEEVIENLGLKHPIIFDVYNVL